MQAEQKQRQGEPYTGPVVVEVPKWEWKSFAHHAPDWWPRTWATPNRAVVARVDQALRKLLAA